MLVPCSSLNGSGLLNFIDGGRAAAAILRNTLALHLPNCTMPRNKPVFQTIFWRCDLLVTRSFTNGKCQPNLCTPIKSPGVEMLTFNKSSGKFWQGWTPIHSLKLTANTFENRPCPKRKQVIFLSSIFRFFWAVSFREGYPKPKKMRPSEPYFRSGGCFPGKKKRRKISRSNAWNHRRSLWRSCSSSKSTWSIASESWDFFFPCTR